MSSQIEIVKGDITEIEVDCIVNAANSTLSGGGGVDGAIHKVGGKVIAEECQEIIDEKGELKTGEVEYTSAGNLPAEHVIHTVGPVYKNSKDQSQLLANCYTNALNLATELYAESISFPNISTGVYGYPKREAAEIAYKACKDWLEDSNSDIQIYLVCFDDENYELLKELAN